MIDLKMSIECGISGDATVTATAKFASMEDAVRFHDALASLCLDHAVKRKPPYFQWPQRVITAATKIG